MGKKSNQNTTQSTQESFSIPQYSSLDNQSFQSWLQLNSGWSPWWCKKGWCLPVFYRKFNFQSDSSLFYCTMHCLWNYTPELKKLCCCHLSITKSIYTDFDEFVSNFDKPLNHIKQFRPSYTIILGDFNARSKLWRPEDVASHKGTHWISNNNAWFATIYLRPNSFASQFIMYWPYFYWQTKLNHREWH